MVKKTLNPLDMNNGSEKKLGLSALLTGRKEESFPETSAGSRPVAVTKIAPNPHQPRTKFDAEKLNELAESIKAHGIIQPLIVTAGDEPDTFFLIAGERRWRAAQLAGLTEVPVLVREATPKEMAQLALVENVQRADLNALEEALAYQDLSENFHLTHAEIADSVGKGRATITNTLRLLDLPEEIRAAVLDGWPETKARALLPLKENPAKMIEIYLEAFQNDATRDWIDAKVKQALNPTPSSFVSARPMPVANGGRTVAYSPPPAPVTERVMGGPESRLEKWGETKPEAKSPVVTQNYVDASPTSLPVVALPDDRKRALSVIQTTKWETLTTDQLVAIAEIIEFEEE